jgi:hypothetical protein
MAGEGPKANLCIATIASRLSRLSLKFSFSGNNDYGDNLVIFFAKNDHRLEPFFREKRSEMIIIINPIPDATLVLPLIYILSL